MTGLLQAAEPRQPYDVFYVDIARFGQVNQGYGYAAGSSVFVGISRRIKQFLPREVGVAQAGGDKFLIARKVGDHDHGAF